MKTPKRVAATPNLDADFENVRGKLSADQTLLSKVSKGVNIKPNIILNKALSNAQKMAIITEAKRKPNPNGQMGG